MVGALLGAVFLAVLLKYGGKEGDSDWSTAMLTSLFVWVASMLLNFLLPGLISLVALLAISILCIKKFCMLPWGKAALFGALYVAFQILISLAFGMAARTSY
jgi:hypothetical protein